MTSHPTPSDHPTHQRLVAVQDTIALHAKRVDRSVEDVEVVVVSKTFGAEHIRPVLEAGHRVFGENRVQETQQKWPELRAAFPDVVVHLIGPLQTNKVKDAVAAFDVIETVDRPKLAKALAAEMTKQNRQLPVYVQVNTGSEDQKAGIMPEAAEDFVAECRNMGLNVIGLMCIPPIDDEPSVHFGFLRALAQRVGLEKLSMGMSSDYPIAIEMGATSVRVGSAIFGARTKP